MSRIELDCYGSGSLAPRRDDAPADALLVTAAVVVEEWQGKARESYWLVPGVDGASKYELWVSVEFPFYEVEKCASCCGRLFPEGDQAAVDAARKLLAEFWRCRHPAAASLDCFVKDGLLTRRELDDEFMPAYAAGRQIRRVRRRTVAARGELHYPDGTLLYRGDIRDGLEHGEGTRYRHNGRPWCEGQFRHGMPHGRCRVYFPNGELKFEGSVSNGLPRKGKQYTSGDLRFVGEFGSRVRQTKDPGSSTLRAGNPNGTDGAVPHKGELREYRRAPPGGDVTATGPWAGVGPEQLGRELERSLKNASRVEVGGGAAYLFERPTSLDELLLAVADRGAITFWHYGGDSDDRRNYEELVTRTLAECLREEPGREDVLARCLGSTPSNLVVCSNPTSMVSGRWGLSTFEVGNREFVYSFPDDAFSFEDERQIYGAWEPSSNYEALRHCFLAIYTREWRNLGLPPAQFECVDGPLDLLTDAVMKLGGPGALLGGSDRRSEIVEKIAQVGRADLETVADEADVPLGALTEAVELLGSGRYRQQTPTAQQDRALVALSLYASRLW